MLYLWLIFKADLEPGEIILPSGQSTDKRHALRMAAYDLCDSGYGPGPLLGWHGCRLVTVAHGMLGVGLYWGDEAARVVEPLNSAEREAFEFYVNELTEADRLNVGAAYAFV